MVVLAVMTMTMITVAIRTALMKISDVTAAGDCHLLLTLPPGTAAETFSSVTK
jgi:hypothetical protein